MTYEDMEKDWNAVLSHLSMFQSKYSLTSATLILPVDWRDMIGCYTSLGSLMRKNSKFQYMAVNVTFGRIESRDAITYY